MDQRPHRKELPSLLPYLNGGENRVALSLTCRHAPASQGSYPFCIANCPDAVSTLFEGEIVTDAGSVVRKVFLLVQREQYRITEDELWPVTNPDVEKAWQDAFSLYQRRGDPPCILLSAQSCGEGEFKELAPLFYCRATERYFHPPCPRCGDLLQLCKDDLILASSGLRPYSSSLKRYLFCPQCSGGRGADFYTYELDSTEPATVMDRWALISQFALLGQVGATSTPFPCPGCSENQSCYTTGKAGGRIVPFSFYPFYLLIFDSYSVNAVDFLPLLGGASFADVAARLETNRQIGRINCLTRLQQIAEAPTSLFPASDDRYFLEVLYLKLTFLADVLNKILSGAGAEIHPDLRVAIDKIWVNLSEKGEQLPLLWNFKTGIIDLAEPAREKWSVRVPGTGTLFYLGLLWFYTLLANKKVCGGEVISAVKDGVAKGTLPRPLDALFQPEQIFFDPQGKAVHRKWLPLWESALDLGQVLLESSTCGQKWTGDDFLSRLLSVRESVKTAMFAGGAAVGETAATGAPEGESVAADEEMRSILQGIARRWRQGAEKEKEKTPAKEGRSREEMETVIMSAVAGGKPSASAPQGDEVTSTVVLRPSSGAAPPPEEETVTLARSEGARGREADRSAEVVSDDVLAKTVAGPGAGKAPRTPEEEILAATVALSGAVKAAPLDGESAAGAGPVPRAKEPPHTREEDLLAETVVLSSPADAAPAAQHGAGEDPEAVREKMGRDMGQSGRAAGEEPLPETVDLSGGSSPEGRQERHPAEEEDLLATTVVIPPKKKRTGTEGTER